MRFCGNCAAALSALCSSCGAENPEGNRFCGYCGALVDAGAGGERGAGFRAPVSELKQVTVMFCDLVDSTALAERLGAEAMHELIRWFIDTALDGVRRYGGTAPQFTGDGFMALFGAPFAHEDHVHRALLAALAIRGAVVGNGPEGAAPSGHNLQLRIGVHTGFVVFGSIGGNLRMDPTAIGDTANVAARLQEAADPGAILISEETRQLARGYVRIKPLRALTLKGKRAPIAAHLLLGVSHRLLPEEATGPSRPFIDRAIEMALLHDMVQQVGEGRGQAIGIIGEPGIGKSRLLTEFRTRIGGGLWWIEGRCLSYGTTTPYLLVLDMMRGLCGNGDADTPDVTFEKLRSALQAVGMDPDRDGPLLMHLFGVSVSKDLSVLSSPETVKAKAFAALRQLLVDSSRTRPIVLLLEDLHWIDKISEEFLAFLAESLSDAPILLLATYRPGYRPPWLDRPYAGQLSLRPLSRPDSLNLVRSARKDLDEPVTEAILAKADGNPLFLEQLALHAGESRDGDLAGMVPGTIHDVVMARLDRLPSETKRLVQTASAIGREFSGHLLRAVWQGAGRIEPMLRELVSLDFISERDADPEQNSYSFRHALTQQIAYASLLESYRRGLHAILGREIERLYEGRTEEVAERLAYHFGRSDASEAAVDYAIEAAEKAQRRWANSEAQGYFDAALRRLDTMPDTEANQLRRIDAVLKQAEVKYALGAPAEQLKALETIRGIVERVSDPYRRASWFYWTGFLHSQTGGQPKTAIRYCLEAVKIAAEFDLNEIHAFANACLAQVYIVAGQLHNAMEAGGSALSIFEARGQLWWASRTLWLLSIASNYIGEWGKGLEYGTRALDHAAALDDLRLKVASAYRLAATLIQKGEVERGLQLCDEALALGPVPRDATWARAVRGYGKVKIGEIEGGISELSEALAWFKNSQMQYAYLIVAIWLAEGYLQGGNRESARPLIENVLEISKKMGYRHYEGRAYWLLGDCDNAEGCNDAAMQIFEEVGARNDLARTMVSRAQFRKKVGDIAAARQLLMRAMEIFEALDTREELASVKAGLVVLASE
jgi:class 3 adenylate cyclase/tetratricopeptide (TPR) repeat protein